MERKSTDDLTQELMQASDLDRFLKSNEDQFDPASLTDALHRIFSEKNIPKARLARQSGMSEVFLHQIFSGRRRPSRTRLICLGIGLGCGPGELQALLKQGGYAPLYARYRSDAIVLYGLQKGLDLLQINELLLQQEESPLC